MSLLEYVPYVLRKNVHFNFVQQNIFYVLCLSGIISYSFWTKPVKVEY